MTVGLFAFYLSQQPDLLRDATRRDFITVYVGGQIVLKGQLTHLYDIPLQTQLAYAATVPYPPALLPNVYPPWNSYLLAALAWLPYDLAYWLWFLLNLAVAAWAIYGLLLLTRPSATDRPVLLLAAWGFAPLFHSLWQGQMSVIALLGLTGAVLMFRRGADQAAGLWLLLVLFKTQLVPLIGIALLIWRKPRAVISFVLGSSVLLAGSLLLSGNWIRALLPFLQSGLDDEARLGYTLGMANWRGLLYVLIGNDTSPLAHNLETLLVTTSLILVAFLCWPYSRWGRADNQVRFALAAILLLLVSPHLYIHDVVVVLLPGFLLWRASTSALALQPTAILHRLRWLLGLGPVVFYAMQIWHPPFFQIGAWYLVLVLALAFATRSLFTPADSQLPPVA
ncbi:MAG: DUF2029 domain-containing protein [Chloroflexota bacterium]|nr:DUF2029 domain-containing protein [Chloroflexota bacterium]